MFQCAGNRSGSVFAMCPQSSSYLAVGRHWDQVERTIVRSGENVLLTDSPLIVALMKADVAGSKGELDYPTGLLCRGRSQR